MAAPLGVKLIRPWRLWLIFNALAASLFVGAAFSLQRVATFESKRLAELQLDTLMRSRLKDIERGDIRAVVDGLGRDAGDLYFRVVDGKDTFSSGNLATSSQCAHNSVQTLRDELDNPQRRIEFTLCRPFNSPLKSIGLVGAIFLLVSLASMRVISRLEKAATATLVGFFRQQSVDVEEKDGLAGILAKVDDLRLALSEAQSRMLALEKAKALGELAQQVAHDIRSPLATLKMAMHQLDNTLPGKLKMLMHGAATRLTEIANELLESRGRKSIVSASTPTIIGVLEAIYREKSFELSVNSTVAFTSDFKLDASVANRDMGAVKINGSTLQTVISNLINNAVEACMGVHANSTSKSQIILRAANQEEGGNQQLTIEVEDNGPGIPEHLRTQLAQRGATFGKASGHGLGLFHARTAIEAAGGTFSLATNSISGAIVRLTLPVLQQRRRCVLLDDDVFIREAWKLSCEKYGVDLLTFATIGELEESLSLIDLHTTIFIDSELSDAIAGEVFAARLFEKGYREIYIASGYDPQHFTGLSYIKGAIGKEPPAWLFA